MKINIPLFLENSIRLIDNHKAFIVLIRHSDRNHIEKGQTGEACTLTDVGNKKAELLGSMIGERLSSALISPLLRCRQTANQISKGAGKKVILTPSSALGEPGSFVFDQIATPMFLEKGTEQVVLDLLDGLPLPGIRNVEDGSKYLLNEILKTMPEKGCSICVSHDAIVMPFVYWATKGAYPKKQWLEPLDGCLLVPEGNGVTVIWNGQYYPI